MALHLITVSILWLLLLLLPTLLILKLLKTGSNDKQDEHLPPGPPKLPIIGNLHQLGGSLPHQSLWHLSKQYGPVLHLQLGKIPTVIISSAEAAMEVMKTHDLATCSRPHLKATSRLTYNYSDIGFAPYGEGWRQRRKLCVLELFSAKRVNSFRFLRDEEVSSVVTSISQSAASATPVNIVEKVYSFNASVLFRMAFGMSFRGSRLGHDKFHEVVNEVETLFGTISHEECFPRFGWILDKLLGRQVKLERVFKTLDGFFEQVINEHLQPSEGKQQEDFIDVMMSIEMNQKDGKLRKENIKAVLLNLFLGGSDTVSLTVIWAMAELAKKPMLMKKAQEEIRERVGEKKRTVTEDDLDQLEYLKMITKETLRLHPPAPLLLPREVMSHFKINGQYDVFPGTMLQVNAWAIARDPKSWEDPEEFHPERFLNSSVDYKGQNFEYLPFGAGRRGCPGIYMGILNAEILLANLLFCFDWKLPSGMQVGDISMEESLGASATIGMKEPLVLLPVVYPVP